MSSNTSDISSSLLSLSIAAASAARIPVSSSVDTTTSETSAITAITSGAAATTNSFTPGSYNGPSSLPSSSSGNVNIASAKLHGGLSKHRRMSSTGLTKRRLSDAREAAARPSSPPPSSSSHTHPSLLSATLQQIPHTSTTAVSATRSASSSPLSSSNAAIGAPQSFASAASGLIARSRSSDGSASSVAPLDGSGSVKEEDEDKDNASNPNPSTNGEVSVGGGISIRSATGKKRGTIFKCESCSKVYRHPSCLIKHRWEHSPHWREASKFLLSKHQQVQLLEAAAILSHISPSATGGTSLPEDRSLWPSFLSGGLLPPPSTSNITSPTNGTGNTNTNATSSPRPGSSSSLDANPAYPISSSVPSIGMTRSTSTGPRLYDYSIVNGGAGGITHVRPGVLGVPTGPSPPAHASSEEAMGVTASGMTRAVPMPINVNNTHNHSFSPSQFGIEFVEVVGL
ncbi:hypothetical protein NLI96_g10519 [Meripilus lineatus]|uniref:C2H2-type domain-containing protein n=1 Tax=Meripilus lineatus TaxID=2056292 RepID=A0AAD5YBW7_9APHY|nr:hypothetical protein NLI96_g10519 [Physisporinus lineatus]